MWRTCSIVRRRGTYKPHQEIYVMTAFCEEYRCSCVRATPVTPENDKRSCAKGQTKGLVSLLPHKTVSHMPPPNWLSVLDTNDIPDNLLISNNPSKQHILRTISQDMPNPENSLLPQSLP